MTGHERRLLPLTLMAVVALATVVPSALAAAPAPQPDTLRGDSARPASAITEHVIIVSIDGLRPDAIEDYDLVTLKRLMEGGSYSLDAQTIFPSKTLPSHTSMLTGRTPEGHGITFNKEMPGHGVVQVPTIFELARARGYHTAAFYSKAKFRHLDRQDSYDHRRAPASNTDNWMATRTLPEALQYLRQREPNLMFVHIGEPDFAGHVTGWMSFFYGLAAKRADGAVGRLMEAAEETYGAGNFTILVTADHGGHDNDHGSDHEADTTIPWIVYGQGVQAGQELTAIRTMDTAATALWLLGLSLPPEAEGHVVAAAFQDRARILAGASAGSEAAPAAVVLPR